MGEYTYWRVGVGVVYGVVARTREEAIGAACLASVEAEDDGDSLLLLVQHCDPAPLDPSTPLLDEDGVTLTGQTSGQELAATSEPRVIWCSEW